MESEDKVISEVQYFSKSSHCCKDSEISGGKEDNLSQSKLVNLENVDTNVQENSLEANETEHYTCLLGSCGQIVLWNPESETVLSRFDFIYPQLDNRSYIRPSIDKDLDYQVIRKKNLHKEEGTLIIEHQSATSLDLVGEQVWRGAFFLADFILNNIKLFKDASVLEVASGVGLTSIVAALMAKKVITTDVNKGEILELIRKNVKRNSELCRAKIHIREIDFFDLRTITDLGSLNDDVTFLLAADVVYNNRLTDAFMKAVLHLMKRKPNKTMFISLEKRYVFTIEDMDTIAPCYEHFVSGLEWLQSQDIDTVEWNIEQLATEDLPQYFTYERTKELVLWKIEAIIK